MVQLITKIALCALLLSSYAAFARTKVVYGECFQCSEPSAFSVAVSLAQEHADVSSLINAHIADISNQMIYSFKVVDRDGDLTVQTMVTPSDLNIKMNDFKEAYSDFKHDVADIVIPASIIGSAWEYTNCAYCENHVTTFLADSANGTILAAGQKLESLAIIFGLFKVDVPSDFNFPLEVGGFITVELSVNANGELKGKIISISDAAGNSVPFDKSLLDGRGVILENTGSGAAINSFINNFNFYVPSGVTGKVTITDIQ